MKENNNGAYQMKLLREIFIRNKIKKSTTVVSILNNYSRDSIFV